MKKSIPLKEYVSLLRSYSNKPLTLNRITLPFGVITGTLESSTILVGHVLDELVQKFPGESSIDIVDVITAAYGLGHEEAEVFLDHASKMIHNLSKESGSYGLH